MLSGILLSAAYSTLERNQVIIKRRKKKTDTAVLQVNLKRLFSTWKQLMLLATTERHRVNMKATQKKTHKTK